MGRHGGRPSHQKTNISEKALLGGQLGDLPLTKELRVARAHFKVASHAPRTVNSERRTANAAPRIPRNTLIRIQILFISN
jgi:hypothetical protein